MAESTLPTKLTYDDYRLIPPDRRRYELAEGHLHATPAPDTWHQHVLKWFLRILMRSFQDTGRGLVFCAPIDVIFTDEDVFQPDLVVVMTPAQVSRRGIEGPPAIIVEILSPPTLRHDRTVKAGRYAALGVLHYWIADPEARTFECYALEGGRYVLRASGRDHGVLSPPDFPGLAIPLAEIWPR